MRIEKTALERKEVKQKAFDYCLYMMLTSYFASAKCVSKILETQLFLYYRELKDDLMFKMEEKAIELVENYILPKIPKHVLEQRVRVELLWDERLHRTKIKISVGNYCTVVDGEYAGKNTKVLSRH